MKEGIISVDTATIAEQDLLENEPMQLSIVVPVYNEEANVELLTEKIYKVLARIPGISRYELIFVDDGSVDGTRKKLERLSTSYPHFKAIFFRRNFGKTAALVAGFREAKGEFVVTMDGDLQDEAEEIPKLLSKLHEGYDLVCAWRKERSDPAEKIIASRLFNFVISKTLHLPIHDFNCGFKAYRAWCVKDIAIHGNLYRFIPVFVSRQGGKVTETPVKHNRRLHGQSKYGVSRYFQGIFDLITTLLLSRFFRKPLYFFGWIALPLLLIGFATFAFLVGSHLIFLLTGAPGTELINRPLLVISIGVMALGLNVFLVGLLAEFILHAMPSSSRMEPFSIERIVASKENVMASTHR